MKQAITRPQRFHLVESGLKLEPRLTGKLEHHLRGGVSFTTRLGREVTLKLHGDTEPFMGSSDLLKVTNLAIGGHEGSIAVISLNTGEIWIVDPPRALLAFLGFDTTPAPTLG